MNYLLVRLCFLVNLINPTSIVYLFQLKIKYAIIVMDRMARLNENGKHVSHGLKQVRASGRETLQSQKKSIG